jgi:hypothetical protein
MNTNTNTDLYTPYSLCVHVFFPSLLLTAIEPLVLDHLLFTVVAEPFR